MCIGLLVACHQQKNVRREVWPPPAEPEPKVAETATPEPAPKVLDPVVVDLPGAAGLRIAADHMTAIDRADAVVLVTEWPHYRDLDFSEVARSMNGTLFIDGRTALDRDAVTAAGLEYEGIGRRG